MKKKFNLDEKKIEEGFREDIFSYVIEKGWSSFISVSESQKEFDELSVMVYEFILANKRAKAFVYMNTSLGINKGLVSEIRVFNAKISFDREQGYQMILASNGSSNTSCMFYGATSIDINTEDRSLGLRFPSGATILIQY